MSQGTVGPMPQMGFDTWNRGGDEAQRATLWTLEAGHRMIDTAESYGSETAVGRAIGASEVPRREIFLTTKVAPENFRPGQIRPHVEASLDRLGVDSVDLLLLLDPAVRDEHPIADHVGQFAEIRDGGLARHVRVSNFTIRHIDRAMELLGERPIVTNQVEIHAFMQNRPIVEHCRALGVPLTAYAPLARGAVTDVVLLSRIADAHDATPRQVALAFLMREGYAVFPSSGSHGRIEENFVAQEFVLDADEMESLRGLDRAGRWAVVPEMGRVM